MIYDITLVDDDAVYRDVAFYCAVTDYSGPTWKRTVTYDKHEDTVSACDWEFDETAGQFDVFIGTPPRWVLRLFDHLWPQMEHLARTGEKPTPQYSVQLELAA